MSKQSFNVDRTIKIHPNDPSTITNPKNGEILIDSTDSNKLKKYNESNSTWELLAAASSGTASGLQYIDATGSSDVITATFSPVIASLTDGLTILVGAQSANTTTTPTLNVNGLGAKTITKANNLPLVAGDIAASDHEMLLTYNLTLTVWVLHNPIYYPNATSATNIAGGAADSIPYQTAAGTTAFLAIGTQNQVLSVKSGVPAWGNYDPSNMILNPSFENATVGTSWTLGTNVTITATTTSANIADPSGTQAGLVTTSATVPFDIHQDITPPSGLAGTQGEMNWWLNVPAGITDGQVCPRVNGVVLTNYCISTFNDGAYHQYKIPFVFGTAGQTAGVQFKTTASYASGTQTVIVDLATLKAGLSGAGNLQLDNVYSAQITSSTTATNLNKAGWISCVNGGTGIATCTFGSGIFTAVPSCVVSTDDTSNTWARIASITGTSTLTNAGLQVLTLNVSGVSLVNSGSTIIFQKSGNDYLASSSAVYSQASANYSRRYCYYYAHVFVF